MKRTGIMLGLAVVFVLAFIARAEDEYPNLLANPGVEEGETGWGWYRGGGEGKGQVVEGEAHSGTKSYSVQFVKRKDNLASFAVNIGGSNGYKGDDALPVEPDTNYEFSFWVRGDFPSSSVKVQGWKSEDLSHKGRHGIPMKLSKDGQPVNGNLFLPSAEWTRYEGAFRTGASTGRLCIFVHSEKFTDDEPKHLYVDDARIAIAPKTKESMAADARAAAYKKFRDGLSPEQLAWENILETNLGTFYWEGYRTSKAAGHETAWDYVADDPKLSRVLIIGDSISRGYTVPTRHALAGKANVHRAPANCGSTVRGLAGLDVWLGNGKWDLIHFNFGIHDRSSTIETYTKNLETIIAKLKATGATLVWASTTPSPIAGDELCPKMNAAAAEIMKKHGIPITDLYAAVKPHQAEYQNPNDSHFNGAGYNFIGKVVADSILAALKPKAANP